MTTITPTTAASAAKPARFPVSSARFEFQHEIGSGGMGTVYRALDRRTSKPVAIKILKAKRSENPTLHQRLAREFKAASELEHPNIVRAISFETDGELSYLVSELVEGDSLGDRLDKHCRLSEADAVRIITQIAQALHYAHQKQIIHRDVKPDNILLLHDGRAKLTDFGLAKDHADLDGPVPQNSTARTTFGWSREAAVRYSCSNRFRRMGFLAVAGGMILMATTWPVIRLRPL